MLFIQAAATGSSSHPIQRGFHVADKIQVKALLPTLTLGASCWSRCVGATAVGGSPLLVHGTLLSPARFTLAALHFSRTLQLSGHACEKNTLCLHSCCCAAAVPSLAAQSAVVGGVAAGAVPAPLQPAPKVVVSSVQGLDAQAAKVAQQQVATSSADVTPADMTDILNRHNYYRANHTSPALTWNNTLAAGAVSWVADCQFSTYRTQSNHIRVWAAAKARNGILVVILLPCLLLLHA